MVDAGGTSHIYCGRRDTAAAAVIGDPGTPAREAAMTEAEGGVASESEIELKLLTAATDAKSVWSLPEVRNNFV